MQTHGGVASPIWGPLRMAITVREQSLTRYSLGTDVHVLVKACKRSLQDARESGDNTWSHNQLTRQVCQL